eukprot:GILI01009565.1.p1 GENE.GILI01009565.1~~GILI01009565.1.p1  ORF type:complete len:617 (-),score=181.60 GILI01009565.1:473-2173(-)
MSVEAANKFVEEFESRLKPLEREASVAWWQANITGQEADFEKKEQIQNQIDTILSDSASFNRAQELYKQLPAIREQGSPNLARQVEILYRRYLEKHVDAEKLRQMVKLSSDVERVFNTFRARVGDKEMTENDIRQVLKDSSNVEERQQAWEASKKVGVTVNPLLVQLVKLRNECARELGFENYHTMMLFLQEQDPQQLIALFDELDELTREPFRAVKAEIDAHLSTQFNVPVTELKPWHLKDPFFQDAVPLGGNLDDIYGSTDILQVCKDFYNSIGLPIDQVLERSDLYEKDGKSPHAFCIDIDREGDVRVLENIRVSEYWMETSLHELGHAVYSSINMPRSLPYLLRSESHILTTEGIAMLFGRFAKTPSWQDAMDVFNIRSTSANSAARQFSAEEAEGFKSLSRKTLAHQLLIFSRWCQVMLRFEQAMYANPDQDLNALWWDLIERYQLVTRPEDRRGAPAGSFADYAAKIHVVTAPVYYHNYMCGEMFASQLLHAMYRSLFNFDPASAPADADVPSIVGNPLVGKFLKERVFEQGNTLPWDKLIEFSTGEPLNAKAFALDFRS